MSKEILEARLALLIDQGVICDQPGDAIQMLEHWGTLIGHGQCDHPYYVFDGKVWLVSSCTQVQIVGDYFDFMKWAREHPAEFRSVLVRANP